MNQILNLTPAAPAGTGTRAAMPEDDGASAANAPPADSFETVLAGQETASATAASGSSAQLVPPDGGKLRQHPGKVLPGPVADELALAADTGTDDIELASAALAAGASGETPPALPDTVTALPAVVAGTLPDTSPALPVAGPEPGTMPVAQAAGPAVPGQSDSSRRTAVPAQSAASPAPAANLLAPAAGSNALSVQATMGSPEKPLSRPGSVVPVGSGSVPTPTPDPVAAGSASWRGAVVPGPEQTPPGSVAGLEPPGGADPAEPVQVRMNPLASLNAAPATALAPTESGLTSASGRPEAITHPPGHANFGDEFAGRVSWLVKNGASEARLQLNPANLGQLEIKISTDGDRAVIMFSAQHSATREAIDAAMPRLREMLEQSGLQLAHSEVSDHSRSGQHHGEAAGDAAAASLAGAAEDEPADGANSSSYRFGASGSSALVDYYA